MAFRGKHKTSSMNSSAYDDKINSLRATIAWMDLVMANVNESIVVLDKEWQIIFANSYLADTLDSDRVMLLGKSLWDMVPMLKARNKVGSKLPLKSVADLNGIYDLKYKSITIKLLLRGKYVKALNQAVCIMSDVSVELEAEKALMKLHQENTKLKNEIAGLKKKLLD